MPYKKERACGSIGIIIRNIKIKSCYCFLIYKNMIAVFSQFIILIYLVGNTIMKKDLLLFEEREKNGKQ